MIDFTNIVPPYMVHADELSDADSPATVNGAPSMDGSILPMEHIMLRCNKEQDILERLVLESSLAGP